MNISVLSLRLAFLISLVATPTALAQTMQGVPEDFSGLGRNGSSIIVVDDAGKETRGRLLRFDLESLTMTVEGRDLTFERQHVTRVYQRGDSLKNGMTIGLVTGAVVGIAAGVSGTDCGGFFAARPCTGGDKARLGTVGGAVFGALGMGVGAGIDALITGRRLVYERPRRSAGPAISIAQSFTSSIHRLSLTVAW